MNQPEKNTSTTAAPQPSAELQSNTSQNTTRLAGNGVPMPDWAQRASEQMDERIRQNNLEDPTPNTLKK